MAEGKYVLENTTIRRLNIFSRKPKTGLHMNLLCAAFKRIVCLRYISTEILLHLLVKIEEIKTIKYKLKYKKMKRKIIIYVRLLCDYLYYILSNHLVASIIYPTCILIVLIYMLYAKITLGYNFKIIAASGIILLIIELSLFYLINIILFTFYHPYLRLHERNQVRKINEALNIQYIKHVKEKEEIIKRERDVSQRLKDEIFSDEYKSFKKANEEHFKLIKKLEERHKKIVETTVQYVLLELDFLILDELEKMFITNVIKTFVNTGLMPNKTEFESQLINRYNIKSKIYITITRFELGHLVSNLAKYLDKELKEIAKLFAYIFACEDDVDNICKSAKKEREEDRIKLIDNIEDYVKLKEKH